MRYYKNIERKLVKASIIHILQTIQGFFNTGAFREFYILIFSKPAVNLDTNINNCLYKSVFNCQIHKSFFALFSIFSPFLMHWHKNTFIQVCKKEILVNNGTDNHYLCSLKCVQGCVVYNIHLKKHTFQLQPVHVFMWTCMSSYSSVLQSSSLHFILFYA